MKYSEESQKLIQKDPCDPDPCGPNTNNHNNGIFCACTCKPNYFGNPKGGCKRECEANTDCPIDKECKNFRCKDACIRSKCAYNALCTATDHKAICTCPDESTGNPYEECIAITTSKTQKDFAVKRNLLVSRWRSRFAGDWDELYHKFSCFFFGFKRSWRFHCSIVCLFYSNFLFICMKLTDCCYTNEVQSL